VRGQGSEGHPAIVVSERNPTINTLVRLYHIPRLLFWLPPLARERRLLAAGSVVALAVMVVLCIVGEDPKTEAVPIAATAVALVACVSLLAPFRRSWPVWDLLVWENRLPTGGDSPGQSANLAVIQRAAGLVAEHPEGVPAELEELSDADSWRVFWAGFLRAQATIVAGDTPDLEAVEITAEQVGPDLTSRANVMVAVLRSGSERAAGRDWRPPLIACRNKLGLHSLWRGLWPVRYQLIFLAAAPALPWAWWIWGR
jgi:hypothetical protein